MRREILIEKSTLRTFNTLEASPQERLKECLESIAETEEVKKHSKVKELAGPHKSVYRARVGSYRAVFTLDTGRLLIHRVGARSNVYEGINDTYEAIA
jgi:mRNA-degrading endonuclease RelE of RelBE toxin-antitoxin system